MSEIYNKTKKSLNLNGKYIILKKYDLIENSILSIQKRNNSPIIKTGGKISRPIDGLYFASCSMASNSSLVNTYFSLQK